MQNTFTDIEKLSKDSFVVTRLFIYHPAFRVWSFEPYIKCSFRCVYCVSDAQGKSRPAIEPDAYPEVLQQELELIAAINKRWGISPLIMVSMITDAYVPEEAEYSYTRKLLEQLVETKVPYNILTKGLLVERDCDLFLQTRTDYRVLISVASSQNKNLARVEPSAPDVEERIALLNRLNNTGVNVTVNISPWIPDVTDVEAIIGFFPRGTPVSICALEYHSLFNKAYFFGEDAFKQSVIINAGGLASWFKDLCIKGLSNSTNAVYGKQWTQEEINKRYAAEKKRIGSIENIFWAEPPTWNESSSLIHCTKELK